MAVTPEAFPLDDFPKPLRPLSLLLPFPGDDTLMPDVPQPGMTGGRTRGQPGRSPIACYLFSAPVAYLE